MSHEVEMRMQAANFRKQHGFGANEPIRLTSLLMKLNVITFFREIDDKISGMSIKINENRFILINSLKSIGRQHFTICHELYHLYFEKEFEKNICYTETKRKRTETEIRADLFASYLLLPEEGILTLIPEDEKKTNKINLATLIKIEQYYSCSRAGLLTALKRMKYIDSKAYEKYRIGVITDAKRLGYTTELYEKGNDGKIIGDYGEKARRLYDAEKISEQHYLNILMDAGIERN